MEYGYVQQYGVFAESKEEATAMVVSKLSARAESWSTSTDIHSANGTQEDLDDFVAQKDWECSEYEIKPGVAFD